MVKSLPKQSSSSGPKNCQMKSRQFKGIQLRKWGKWVSEIRMPNSRAKIWLGSYDSPEKAARAYDFALYCLRGPKSKFNFPDSPPEIPCASALSPPQIQAAAARFATEDFRVSSEEDAASSSSSPSEADSGIDSQQISAEQYPTFLDSLLLEDLDSGESLDFSMDDFGFEIEQTKDWGLF